MLATAFVYIYTNITTCALTHSPNLNHMSDVCGLFNFMQDFLRFLFLKILMYQSSANLSGWFQLKGKPQKSYMSLCLQNLCF